MIPLTTLCDEYIHRPKLSEQKKRFEYIVPTPLHKRGRYKNNCLVEKARVVTNEKQTDRFFCKFLKGPCSDRKSQTKQS